MMIGSVIYSTVKWSFIKKLGSNKLVQRSYFYLIIVPVLARVLSKVESPLNFVIFGEEIEIIFKLPFTLLYFYIAALFFTLGYLVFLLFVPNIIKENDSFSDFQAEKKGARHLRDYSRRLWKIK